MPRLPVLRPEQVLTALEKAGFHLVGQQGSHARPKYNDSRVVTKIFKVPQ